MTTSDEARDDLRVRCHHRHVSLMQIIKAKEMAVLPQGTDNPHLFFCYLRGDRKFDIVQLKCETAWALKEESKMWKSSSGLNFSQITDS